MPSSSYKYELVVQDWITVSVQLALIGPATWLLWKLWKVTQEIEREKHQSAVRSGRSGSVGSRSMSKSASIGDRLHKLRVKKGAFKFLLFLEPMELVRTTGALMYLRLVLDTTAWVYYCCTRVWDWFVVIIDGVSVFVGTFAATLLVFVFIQRCYMAFQKAIGLQHAKWKYWLVCVLSMLVAMCGVSMAAMSLGLQWWYFGVASMAFVVLLFSATVTTLWMLVGPLLKMAASNQRVADKTLHLGARLTLVSFLSLASTCVTYLTAGLGYNYCNECWLVYLYYCMVALDTLINLMCLTWSLKAGQSHYYAWCSCVHAAFVRCIDKRDAKFRAAMPWDIPDKADIQMGSAQSTASRGVGSSKAVSFAPSKNVSTPQLSSETGSGAEATAPTLVTL